MTKTNFEDDPAKWNKETIISYHLLLLPLWVPTIGTKESRLDNRRWSIQNGCQSQKFFCIGAIALIQWKILYLVKKVLAYFFFDWHARLLDKPPSCYMQTHVFVITLFNVSHNLFILVHNKFVLSNHKLISKKSVAYALWTLFLR